MRLTRLILKNWRNFTEVDVPLQQRVFILGNNGIGKSNLLDALRFLRDTAKEKGGGLQYALDKRDGIGTIRSLCARKSSAVEINVEAEENSGTPEKTQWGYRLVIKQHREQIFIEKEIVKKNGNVLLERPDSADNKDSENLTETALEQSRANDKFRPLRKFFQSFRYLHMVPQLIRNDSEFQGKVLPDDPYGQRLIESMATLADNERKRRLKCISNALQQIKPHFGHFRFERDRVTGKAHLHYKHRNWRKYPTNQNEQQLSDGELRLIGLIFALLEKNKLIMLEEPEIHFNEGIVSNLPGIFAQAAISAKSDSASQIMLTTHSRTLLTDEGIDGKEVLLLTDDNGKTKVALATDDSFIVNDLKAGLTIADTVLPRAQKEARFSL